MRINDEDDDRPRFVGKAIAQGRASGTVGVIVLDGSETKLTQIVNHVCVRLLLCRVQTHLVRVGSYFYTSQHYLARH
jgi:hypothetical protein